MKHIFAAAATVAVAACNPVGVKETSLGSIAYLDKPTSVLRCFDFANNRTLKQEGGYVSMGHGVAYLSTDKNVFGGGEKVAMVAGGSGCVGETVHVNIQDPATAQTVGRLQDRAPNYAVVTNGVNEFIAGGRFSEVTVDRDKGVTTFTLESDKGKIREIQVMGLHMMATTDPEALDPSIREAAGFTKPSAVPAP